MRWATLAGVAALLCWSTTVAVVRTLSEHLGPLRTACCIHLIGGSIACAVVYSRKRQRDMLKALGTRYWLFCGTPFVLYMLCLYLAVGLADSRLQVIGVSLLNYLWPTTTLIFSVWLLGHRATVWLPVGIGCATIGACLAVAGGEKAAWLHMEQALGAPHALALSAGVLWGLYSTLSRRLGGMIEGNAVPAFVLMTGGILLCLSPWFRSEAIWSLRVVLELLYSAIVPTFLAYGFWDLAVRKGDIVLVAALAYFTPLLSALCSTFYLGVLPGPGLWAACGFIIVGAAICRFSMRASPEKSIVL